MSKRDIFFKWGPSFLNEHTRNSIPKSLQEILFLPSDSSIVYLDSSVNFISYPKVEAGSWLTQEFFDWLQETHSPTWLQPLGEPLGSTATAGMAGPNSSSVTSVTFGEPGLVESDRTSALFNTSRIVYPKGAVLDRMHQAAGGTIMFWAKANALMDDEAYVILATQPGSFTSGPGIAIWLEDRRSVNAILDKRFRVIMSNGFTAGAVYNNLTIGTAVQGVATPIGSIIPGQVQHFAISHSAADPLKIYIDGVESVSVLKGNTHSGATSHQDPTVGALRPSDIIVPHKGLLQGITFIPSILTPAQISEIYIRSGGPFV